METIIKIYNKEFGPFLKEATKELEKNKYTLGESKEISFGIQIPLLKEEESIGVIRVYQKKDGTITFDLSTIKSSANREEILNCLSALLKLEFKEVGKTTLPKSCFFRNDNGVNSLFDVLKNKYKELYTEADPKIAQKKVVRLNGTTITLYDNNNLVASGKPTKLSDEVCELIDEAYEQSTREELLSQVMLTIEKEDFKKIKKEFSKIKIDVEDYISNKVYDFLYAHDCIDLKDGIKLLELVKKEKIKFDNYAILVRNFAIVFEGFLIKLFINLGLIADEAFQLTDRAARIGAILDDSKGKSPFEKKSELLYQRRYPYFHNQLLVSWGLRCKYLHSDRYAPHIIKKINEAEAQVRSLIKIMETASEVFQLDKDNNQNNNFSSYIGIDESGKGDYFGPLVIAGVEVDSIDKLMELEKIGVKDSKALTDAKIEILAPKIAKICRHDVVVIKPARYNQLQVELGNLNYLLAWGHARALENLLQKGNSNRAISDQFGDKSYINNALMSKGKKIKLEQRTKAERDIAVAAASIIARYHFIINLREMSKGYKISFPKGASQEVISTAQKFVDKNGFEKLSQVAKTHFKTTKKIKAS